MLGKYLVKDEPAGRRTSESGTTVVGAEEVQGQQPQQQQVGVGEKRKGKKGGDEKGGAGGEDPQECLTCHAKSSPEWRRGPLGECFHARRLVGRVER